ncbi:unnamed protein product, partial [Medioppia subpectinata]
MFGNTCYRAYSYLKSKDSEKKVVLNDVYCDFLNITDCTLTETADRVAITACEQNYVHIEREISILKSCNHVNIVKHYQSWLEQATPCSELDKIYIQMEYCEHNLDHVSAIIQSVYKRKTNEMISPVAYFIMLTLIDGILAGIEYLHSKRIKHRNINMNNILLKGSVVKVCDFGLAKVIESSSEIHSNVGKVSYKAPEVQSGGNYNTLADVYSLGAMFIQFMNVDINKQDVHPELKDLLARMIAGVANKRPTCSELLIMFGKSPVIYDLDQVRADHH